MTERHEPPPALWERVAPHVPDMLRGMRWAAVITWAVLFAAQIATAGVPYFRSDLLLWLGTGLLAGSIGRRRMVAVVLDFVPLAVVLIAYDHLRGLADSLGMPTWWHPQNDVDRALALGHQPTVWLQEHLRHANVRWYDVLTALCYVSFFFLPYVTAAVLWLRSRADFYRWSLRFVALSFLGFAFFALTPAAPPWAASVCTAAQVADHPYDPPCLSTPPGQVPGGGMLGPLAHPQPGTAPHVERIVSRAFGELHLHFAGAVIRTGQTGVDLVAAVPSLHAGGIMLFSIFMWRRVRRAWRPLLVGYPVAMAFSLVYSAEHYLSDVLAGWLAAALVAWAATHVERWRATRARSADTLDSPVRPTSESPCPPIRPLPETTPSST